MVMGVLDDVFELSKQIVNRSNLDDTWLLQKRPMFFYVILGYFRFLNMADVISEISDNIA